MTAFGSDRHRARAALLAAAAGDAVGWPQEPRGGLIGGRKSRDARRPKAEFDAWVRNSGSRFARYHDPIDAGNYSDDTQLMLAVARSCLQGDRWVHHLTGVELPAWPTYQRGGGRAVLAAASAWNDSRPPWRRGRGDRAADAQSAYFDAGANGVAMRIAPHVIWATGDVPEIFRRIVRDGVTTHGHPRALVGALVYAAALDFAFSTQETLDTNDLLRAAERGLIPGEEALQWVPGEWFDTEPTDAFVRAWERTNQETYRLLEIARRSLAQGSASSVGSTLEEIGATGRYGGAGTVTAAAAIYLASRSGTRPISGLLQAAFQSEADTDTLASMTGALLGAIHGDEWLGQLRQVQDADYITRIADQLTAHDYAPPPDELPPHRTFMRLLDDEHRDEGVFPDGRIYRVLHRGILSERPWVIRIQLELRDGQTVVIDRTRRTPPADTDLRPLAVLAAEPVPAPPAAEPSPETPRPKSILSRVVLPSADLGAVATFYGDALGASFTIEADRVVISESLAFARAATQPSLWSADAQIDLIVDDLKAAAERLNLATVRDETGHHIATIDPDGRSVLIRPID